MRPLILAPLLTALLSASALPAADLLGRPDVTVGMWHGMMVVQAPASQAHPLPGAEQRVTVDWREQSIAEVAEFLRVACRINVICLPGTADRTVTLAVQQMPVATLIRWIERQSGVVVNWQDQALTFSLTPITGPTVMRLYDVRDLTMPLQDFPGPELAFSSDGTAVGKMPAPVARAGTDGEELADFIRQQLLKN
jgi:hypothetical protein